MNNFWVSFLVITHCSRNICHLTGIGHEETLPDVYHENISSGIPKVAGNHSGRNDGLIFDLNVEPTVETDDESTHSVGLPVGNSLPNQDWYQNPKRKNADDTLTASLRLGPPSADFPPSPSKLEEKPYKKFRDTELETPSSSTSIAKKLIPGHIQSSSGLLGIPEASYRRGFISENILGLIQDITADRGRTLPMTEEQFLTYPNGRRGGLQDLEGIPPSGKHQPQYTTLEKHFETSQEKLWSNRESWYAHWSARRETPRKTFADMEESIGSLATPAQDLSQTSKLIYTYLFFTEMISVMIPIPVEEGTLGSELDRAFYMVETMILFFNKRGFNRYTGTWEKIQNQIHTQINPSSGAVWVMLEFWMDTFRPKFMYKLRRTYQGVGYIHKFFNVIFINSINSLTKHLIEHGKFDS